MIESRWMVWITVVVMGASLLSGAMTASASRSAASFRTKLSHSSFVTVSSTAADESASYPSNTPSAMERHTLSKSSSPRSRAPSEARLARSNASAAKPSRTMRPTSAVSSSRTRSGSALRRR